MVQGQIRDLWRRTGREIGPLGYPVTSEEAGHGGRVSTFQGTAFWTPGSGAVEVRGDIAARWRALGGFAWALPTSSETAVSRSSGRYNTFSGNRAVYWSQQTGAQAVEGRIRDLWAERGGAIGALGYPVSNEQAAASGVQFSRFQNGIVYWTAVAGPERSKGTSPGSGQLSVGWRAGWACPRRTRP